MNNHIIVGEGRRCLCGTYKTGAVGCAEIITALHNIEDYAQTQANPSLFIRKGERNPPSPPTANELLLICEVLLPLVTDCD
jgi:hypothetical protein